MRPQPVLLNLFGSLLHSESELCGLDLLKEADTEKSSSNNGNPDHCMTKKKSDNESKPDAP